MSARRERERVVTPAMGGALTEAARDDMRNERSRVDWLDDSDADGLVMGGVSGGAGLNTSVIGRERLADAVLVLLREEARGRADPVERREVAVDAERLVFVLDPRAFASDIERSGSNRKHDRASLSSVIWSGAED